MAKASIARYFFRFGFVLILNVVIEGEDQLLGIVNLLRADGLELAHHRRGVVVGHDVMRADGDEIAGAQRALRPLGQVGSARFFQRWLAHNELLPPEGRLLSPASSAAPVKRLRRLFTGRFVLRLCAAPARSHIRLHQRHQLAHRPDFSRFQIASFTFFCALPTEPLRQRREFLFDLLIGQRIPWIALGIIQLLRERPPIVVVIDSRSPAAVPGRLSRSPDRPRLPLSSVAPGSSDP